MSTDESVRIEPAAVAALYAAHAAELRAFLTGLLRDYDLAHDVVQATFSKLAEAGHTAREETLKGWLFRVAYHEALAERRRQNVRQRSLPRLAAALRREAEPPEGRLVRDDEIARVQQALGKLSPEQRSVVQQKIYDGKTYAAIARDLGLPQGTVVARMQAALFILRRELESAD